MSAGQRSKNGCWTCRTRRKKCDEGGPPCGSCHARGLFCHGYGPKPSWKDRGEKERDEARRLHMQSRCGRSRLSSQRSSGSPPALASFLQSSPSSAHAGHGESQMSSLSPSQDLPHIDLFDALDMTSDFWGPSTLAADVVFTSSTDDGSSGSMEILSAHRPRPAQLLFPSKENIGKGANDENELRYLMQFIGETFPILHAGYQNTPLTKRTWLLFATTRSSSFYYACLSMSAYQESQKHFSSLSRDVNDLAYRDYQTYRTLAISRLAELREYQQSLARSMHHLEEEFICVVQLAILEALSDNIQECRLYLASAQKVLHENSLFEAETQLITSQQPSNTYAVESLQETEPIYCPTPMEREAREFYRTIFIWNDILSCSLKGTEPLDTLAYRVILCDCRLSPKFEEVVACQSWILCSLLDVTQLATWKSEQEAQGHLSVRGLVARSEKIESVLEEGIQKLSEIVKQDPTGHDLLASQVHSYIFAHAVLVHLNTIVSGHSPGVPETQQAVERAIAAWEIYPALTDLRLLLWPYYVTAILCFGPQRERFRKLLTERRSESLPNTLLKVTSVVEETWRKLDARASGKDRLSSHPELFSLHQLNGFFF